MSKYVDELIKSMGFLGSKDDVIFLGQSVEVAGTAMKNTLNLVPSHKLLELPVEEEFQLGVSIGFTLTSHTVVSIFPRWNFLLLATNQIVNHLDKLRELGSQSRSGKVIVRTGIGSINPMHPGPQHTGDFTEAFKLMCPNMNVVRLDSAEEIFGQYELAYNRSDGVSTLLVEWSDKYYEN